MAERLPKGHCRTHLTVAAVTASLLALLLFLSDHSAAADPVEIAVFEFELNDASAGGGIIEQDEIDVRNLKEATQEARRLLLASGRFRLVDTGAVANEVLSAGGLRHCGQCDAPLARKLGADQSLVGIVTRVNRTEFTLQIVIRDARTGAVLSNTFSGLRMGANYAWPRGVRSLMRDRILSSPSEE